MQTHFTTPTDAEKIEAYVGDLESELATLEAFLDETAPADDDDPEEHANDNAADADDAAEIEAAKDRIEDITAMLDSIQSALAREAYAEAIDVIEYAAP